MLIWCVPTLCLAGVVLLIDFVVRRKKWSENTKAEKHGLILTPVVSFPYIFCSIYGQLMGIVGPRGEGAFTELAHEALLVAGKGTVVVCVAAMVASVVLRRVDKATAANRALLLGLLYCVVMTGVSFVI